MHALISLVTYSMSGEAGEFIGKIIQNDPIRDFHGYADKSATSKKVVRDVFRKGDYAFLSGKSIYLTYCVKTTYVFINRLSKVTINNGMIQWVTDKTDIKEKISHLEWTNCYQRNKSGVFSI